MIIVTGAVGFIGFHLTKALIEKGYEVTGVDNLNDYYSPQLKKDRLSILKSLSGFTFHKLDISNKEAVFESLGKHVSQTIIHLAAQAGVRYSITNPDVYVKANLVGHCNILELARHIKAAQMIYASSSSIYGGNTKVPFAETDKTDDPVSFYGATKKSNELLSHSYARLYGLSLIGLRFFTVYGPWGRPDMAYWKFAQKILSGTPIDVYNHGNMSRDFTYVDDIVYGILACLDQPASKLELSIPHRVYNLGNDNPEKLMDLITITEGLFGEAEKVFKPMQNGDVQATWANVDRAREELGYEAKVKLSDGLEKFATWYKPNWKKYI